MSAEASPSAAASPPSGNPLSRLDDKEKKYTVVFLLSVGVTLFLTGASSRRLLAKHKASATTGPVPSPSSVPHPPRPPPVPNPSRPPRPAPITASSTPPRIPPTPIRSSLRPKPLLKSWKLTSSQDSATYFLPNSTLLSASTANAEEIDRLDKEHEDGKDEEKHVEDGFNPAVFAAKAFGIATALTVSTFAVGIGGVMYYFGVKDMESLSLALSHSLPDVFNSRRPSLPAWALPSPKPELAPGPEEEVEESKEGVAYWTMVKQQLDKEAEERLEERRKAWVQLVRSKGKTEP